MLRSCVMACELGSGPALLGGGDGVIVVSGVALLLFKPSPANNAANPEDIFAVSAVFGFSTTLFLSSTWKK